MARLPISTPNIQARVSVGAARKSGEALAASGRVVAQAGRSVSDIGRFFTDMAKATRQAQDLQEYTRAKTESAVRISGITERATAQDIRYNTQKEFDEIIKNTTEQLEIGRKEVVSKVTNLQTKTKLNGSYALLSMNALNSIKRVGRKRLNDSMRNDMVTSVNKSSKDYAQSGEENKAFNRNEIIEAVQNHIALGVISKSKGNQYLRDTLNALPVLDAQNAINRNPALGRRLIIERKFGIKDDVERRKLIDLATSLEKRNTEEAKLQLNINHYRTIQDVGSKILENKITVEMLDDPKVVGTWTKAEINVAKSLVRSDKKVNPVMKAQAYNEITDAYYQLNIVKKGKRELSKTASIRDFSNYSILLMDKLAKGEITQGTYQTWSKKADEAFDNKLEDRIDTGYLKEQNTFPFFDWWATQHVAKEDKNEATMFLKRRFTEELEKGRPLEKEGFDSLANRIVGEYLQIAPNVNERGVEKTDPVSGERAIVYPDFSYRLINPDGTLGPLVEEKTKGK